MIEPRHIPLDGEDTLDYDHDQEPSWDLIKSDEVVQPSPLPIPNHHRRTQGSSAGPTQQQGNSSSVTSYPTPFNAKINTAGIFNTVRFTLILLQPFEHRYLIILFAIYRWRDGYRKH